MNLKRKEWLCQKNVIRFFWFRIPMRAIILIEKRKMLNFGMLEQRASLYNRSAMDITYKYNMIIWCIKCKVPEISMC